MGDVLFGVESPGGKLPITFPTSVSSNCRRLRTTAWRGRTYRYMTEEPLYPFGFGLSYATFAYRNLAVKPAQAGARVSVTVRNAGDVGAEEVVQVYLTQPKRRVVTPRHSLVAFRRIRLAPGQRKTVIFRLSREAFKYVDAEGTFVFARGRFSIVVGGCSPGSRGEALGAPRQLAASVTI